MTGLGLELYQPTDRPWRDYAARGGLRSVLDPADQSGRKNRYIDALHKSAIRSLGLPVRDTAALDYGCGNGRVSRFLRDHCSTVVGVDITPDMLVDAAAARSNNDFYLLNDPVALPFAPGSFDLIVSTYVLQYFALERPVFGAAIDEFRRVLKPGGLLLIIEQVTLSERGSGSVRRGCRIDDYAAPISAAGFEPRHGFVVRLGETGWLVRRTLLRRDLPEVLHQAIVSRVLRRNRRRDPERLTTTSYADYLFCFAKRGT